MDKNNIPENPLIAASANNPHYLMYDDMLAIERLEQMYTKYELMMWAKITASKYMLRIGSKIEGDTVADFDRSVLKDVRKKITYEQYYTYLKDYIEREAAEALEQSNNLQVDEYVEPQVEEEYENRPEPMDHGFN